MSEIRSAHVVLLCLFDIAETIDQHIPGLIGGPTVAARFAPKQATPAYVQYDNPPVSFGSDAVGVADGFRRESTTLMSSQRRSPVDDGEVVSPAGEVAGM